MRTSPRSQWQALLVVLLVLLLLVGAVSQVYGPAPAAVPGVPATVSSASSSSSSSSRISKASKKEQRERQRALEQLQQVWFPQEAAALLTSPQSVVREVATEAAGYGSMGRLSREDILATLVQLLSTSDVDDPREKPVELRNVRAALPPSLLPFLLPCPALHFLPLLTSLVHT